MKKIFILLFLISIPKSFAQTYSFVLAYSAQGTLCNYGAHGAYMKADNVSIYDGVTYGTYPANFNNRAFTLKKITLHLSLCLMMDAMPIVMISRH